MVRRVLLVRFLGLSLFATGLLSGGCDGGGNVAVGGQGGTGAAASSGGHLGGGGSGGLNLGGELNIGGGVPNCIGLECQQTACGEGETTSIKGTVFDPSGKVPLHNVVVYVPNAPLDPIVNGASCDKCGSTLSGSPLVTTITGTSGEFVLDDMPAGDDIPLVMQVGKWRRQIVIPKVEACFIEQLVDPTDTHLPRSTDEGDMPQIALTTGGADPLECLLRKIGIADKEFDIAGGPGRVHLYYGAGGSAKYAGAVGGGQTFGAASDLWATVDSLKQYDVLLMACEGDQNSFEKPPEALQAMFDYTGQGGRVFASHWNNYWLEAGPEAFPQTASFNHQPDLDNPFTALVDNSFPKGAALAEWLVNVGASTTLGEIEIKEAQHTVDAVNPAISQQWIYSMSPQSVQYFTFNTPIGVPEEEQCGRVVFSDIHVSSGDNIGVDFPDGCVTTDLSPQEKALLFMLFDLSSCIQPDDDPIVEPPT